MDQFKELYLSKVMGQVCVFVSHSGEDKCYADGLVRILQEAGMTCFSFVFTPIPIGDVFPEKIKDALQKAQFVIVLWSTKAISSDWIAKEIDYALENKKPIIPVLLEDGVELPNSLEHVMAVQAYNDPSGWPLQIKKHIQRIVRDHFEKEYLERKKKESIQNILLAAGKGLLIAAIGWMSTKGEGSASSEDTANIESHPKSPPKDSST